MNVISDILKICDNFKVVIVSSVFTLRIFTFNEDILLYVCIYTHIYMQNSHFGFVC